MKKIVVVLFLVVVCLIGCGNKTSEGGVFTLEGVSHGFADSTQVFLYYDIENAGKLVEKADTAYTVDGVFSFRGNIDGLVGAILRFEDFYEVDVYLESAKITVEVDKEALHDYKLSGLSVDKEIQDLQKALSPIDKQLEEEYKKVGDVLKEFNEDNEKLKDTVLFRLDEALRTFKQTKQEVLKLQLEFVKEHMTYRIAPFLLYTLARGDGFERDTLMSIYTALPESSKTSPSGRLALLQLNMPEDKEEEEHVKKEKAWVGRESIDFERKDLSGKTIKLSDYRNKNYVLLDFWASWCPPCLFGIPKVKRINDSYREKGLEIIGISLDEGEADWRKAIERYDMEGWTQLLSSGADGEVKISYEVQTIPVYVLIDKQGKIVGRWQKIDDQVLGEIDRLIGN